MEQIDISIARIAKAVQVTLLPLSLPLSLKSLPKVSQKSPKSLSKMSTSVHKCLQVSTSVYDSSAVLSEVAEIKT